VQAEIDQLRGDAWGLLMRIRSIKPEFWTDKRVASWDLFTRLFFVGLWSAADDHGRGSAEPARLAAELFPYDLSRDARETLANVSRALATLSESRRVTFYRIGDEDFFEIANWGRHQRVDKPGKSRIPEPCASDVVKSRETLARPSRLEQGTGSVEMDQGPSVADVAKNSGQVLLGGVGHEEKNRDGAGISWSALAGWSGITDADRAAWRSAYPCCDIERQLAAMGEWLRSNPEKARKRSWRRFLTNWLSRSQERGGDQAARPSARTFRPPPGGSSRFADAL
jgi:hypothetical protein